MIVGEKLANALIGVIVSQIAQLRQRLFSDFFQESAPRGGRESIVSPQFLEG
jgi:hypothetical protein